MAPPNPPRDGAGEGLALVHVANSAFEAYALRARLESEDIPVFLKGESEGPYRVAYAPVYLFVAERFEVQARLVLAEASDAARAGKDLPDPGE